MRLSLHPQPPQARPKETVEAAILFRPHAVVTIDSKGFSFRLLKQLKAPSFGAWKGGEARLNGLSEFINHVLCILPFEEEIRISHGVAATFLGHPVFEDILDLNMVNLANGGGVTVENEIDLKEVISGMVYCSPAQGKVTTENGCKVHGNADDFRSTYGIPSGGSSHTKYDSGGKLGGFLFWTYHSEISIYGFITSKPTWPSWMPTSAILFSLDAVTSIIPIKYIVELRMIYSIPMGIALGVFISVEYFLQATVLHILIVTTMVFASVFVVFTHLPSASSTKLLPWVFVLLVALFSVTYLLEGQVRIKPVLAESRVGDLGEEETTSGVADGRHDEEKIRVQLEENVLTEGPEPMEIDSKSSSSFIPNSGVAVLQGHASKNLSHVLYGFDLEDLLGASTEVLGKGTFGTTYKAVLEMGFAVAVKRLKDVTIGDKEFKEKIEDVGNKGVGRTSFNWETRSAITLGAAREITYLHAQGSTAQLVCPNATPTRVDGYRAPEVTDIRKVFRKVDVYSFGVLLELLTVDMIRKFRKGLALQPVSMLWPSTCESDWYGTTKMHR
ncbi:no exine formation 1 isoform 1 [Tanacetum coccineum]|uniref:No exine formation 1 isoform 1 n=1 Tax=Tanacetum coccineum TaxID=301880 RepID=A0ABQ4WV91_9ASTR